MSVLRGDFIGFSYNGKHSSDLGIVRTSNGSRFDENLLPTMQDKTAQVPGGDGTYYFGSYYTQRQFSVSFAFDSLTEEQIAEIKRVFGDKKIHDLIFDERPYKTWKAKVTGSATMKHIPFAEGETNRTYKGEGTIQFTCYQPYAVCEKKWLSDYEKWNNVNEWKIASGLLSNQGGYDVFSANSMNLYNPGDLESHFQMRLNFERYEKTVISTAEEYAKGMYYVLEDGQYKISNEEYNPEVEYFNKVITSIPEGQINIDEDSSKILKWKEISPLGDDVYIKINTKLNLIEGYRAEGVKSGNIYNYAVTEGTFFTIPQGESTLIISADVAKCVKAEKPIEYNYYYY